MTGTVLGVVAVAVLWAAARFELCGLSGCGGGGFGRSYSPQAVIALLLLSGVVAAGGLLLAVGRPACSRRGMGVAGALLVLVPILGAVVIGSRADGYPRSVSPETLERDLERARERRR